MKNFEKLEDCDCEEWRIGIKQIGGITMLAYAHNIFYTAGQFRYCPWCGKKRKEMKEEKESDKDILLRVKKDSVNIKLDISKY
jgi:hypothetical protein